MSAYSFTLRSIEDFLFDLYFLIGYSKWKMNHFFIFTNNLRLGTFISGHFFYSFLKGAHIVKKLLLIFTSTCLLLTFVMPVYSGDTFEEALRQDFKEAYNAKISTWNRKLEGYRQKYIIQVVIVLIIGISGIIMTAIHDKKFKYKTLCMFILGVICVSSLQLIHNTFFPVGHHEVARIILKYERAIEDFRDNWEENRRYTSTMMGAFRKSVLDYKKKFREIDNLYYKTGDTGKPDGKTDGAGKTGLSIFFLPTEAFAQDARSFNGEGRSDSLNAAESAAKESAFEKLTEYILEKYQFDGNQSVVNQMRDRLKEEAARFFDFRFKTKYENNQFLATGEIEVYDDELDQFLEYFLLEYARTLPEVESPSAIKEQIYDIVLKINKNNREAKYLLAELIEKKGFQFLIENDREAAIDSFGRVEKIYPAFHSAYEISKWLKDHPSINGEVLYKIVTDYKWKAPKDLVQNIKDRLRKIDVVFEKVKIHKDFDIFSKGDIWFAFNVNGKKMRWPEKGTLKLGKGIHPVGITVEPILLKDEILLISAAGTEEDPSKNRNQRLGTVDIKLHGENEWEETIGPVESTPENGAYTLYLTLSAATLAN